MPSYSLSSKTNSTTLPVMKPLLPKQNSISPFLKEIDKNRYYSNFGPLVNEFEIRLADFFCIDSSCISTFSSATSALTCILQALNIPKGKLCIMPNWTFAAVPSAICSAGLTPYLLDVDKKRWDLTSEKVMEALPHINTNDIGALIYVAPFGKKPPIQEWEKFSKQTSIPIIIDAAACFDAVSLNTAHLSTNIPVIVSLHATKSFGIGEGGIALCNDKLLIAQSRQCANFGLSQHCNHALPGSNGKMSEYTAAVGLAALNEWPEKRQQWKHITASMTSLLNAYDITHNLSQDWISSTCNIELDAEKNDSLQQYFLEHHNIETRQWWKHPINNLSAYTYAAQEKELPHSLRLSQHVLGLPFFVDMGKTEIQLIENALQGYFSKTN